MSKRNLANISLQPAHRILGHAHIIVLILATLLTLTMISLTGVAVWADHSFIDQGKVLLCKGSYCGRYSEAIEDFDKALTFHPDDGSAYEQPGAVFKVRGETYLKMSEQDMSKAARLGAQGKDSNSAASP